jgi:hypothetical protein
MDMNRFKKRLDIRIVLIVVSLLAVLWIQTPRLTDEYKVDEDFRTFYWMNKFQDSSIFPNDQLQRYYISLDLPWGTVPITFYSLGYGLLFYAASFAVTPILFSKILPFFLMSITVWYLYGFGQSVRDRPTGIVLALGFLFLNLASSSAISIANGLQRSFATTLIIALIYYLHRRTYGPTAIVLVVSALIYPPMFALGGLIWGIYVLWQIWSRRPAFAPGQGGLVFLLISGGVSVLILAPAVFPGLTDFIGRDETVVERRVQEQVDEATAEPDTRIWNNPVYRTGGAYPLFIIFPIVGRGGLVDLGEDLINLLILLSVGLLILLVRGRKTFDLPYEVWCLLLATPGMFALSWLAIWLTNSFLLYLPSRYTRVGLFLFLLIFVVLNFVDFIREAPLLLQRNPRRLIWLVVGIELLVVVLILFYPADRASIGGFNMKYLLAAAGIAVGMLGVTIIRDPARAAPNMFRIRQTYAGRALAGLAVVVALSGWAVYAPLLTEVSYLDPPPAERELLAFLETLPKDAVIAGAPCALDSVQLFAKRRALMSCEAPRADEVVDEVLQAYYADNRQTVADFCRTHEVDYLVVDLNTYSKEYLDRGWVFFEPHNGANLPQIRDQERFVLAEVPDETKLFQHGDYYVAVCDSIGSKLPEAYQRHQ